MEGTEFSVCLVIADDDKQARAEWSQAYDDEFVYHRLDLKRPSFETVCNYYGRLALKGIFYAVVPQENYGDRECIIVI